MSFAKSDYGFDYIKGYSLYGDADFHQRLGLEVNVNIDNVFTPEDIGEKSFMVGPRYILTRQEFAGREDFFRPYVKALAGVGIFQFQKGNYPATQSESYGAFSIGGGIDLHVARRINVRPIDLAWQRWPNFPNTLKPVVVTMGAAYRF